MRLSAAIKAAVLGSIVIAALGLHARYGLTRLAPEQVRGMGDLVPPGHFRLVRAVRSLPPRGALVLFRDPHSPSRRHVARVVGLPGDRIAVRDGEVYRNGDRVEDDGLAVRARSETLPEITVPVWHVWLLKDERGDSRALRGDSRSLGPVALGWIEGRIAGGARR